MQKEIIKIENFIWNSFDQENRIGLFNGLAGLALFYHYLNEAYKKDEYQNKLITIVEKIDFLLETNEQLTFCTGLAGYGVMLLKVKSENLEIDETYFESIDALLAEQLEAFSIENNYDFFHGAMGISMYFIERYKHNPINGNVNRILNEFSNELINKINTNFSQVLKSESVERGTFYSFGLAHGLAGFINHLIYLKQNFLELKTEISDSIKICVDFLYNFKKKNLDSNYYYPNVYCIREDKFIESRLAWCQGDLGISNSLLNAGAYLNNNEYIAEAKEMISNSLNFKFNQSGINDFGICHGSCGLIVQYDLFNKKNIGITFDSHIEKWFETIKNQTNDFENFYSFDVLENKNFTECNLLEGAVGLGLTILTLNNKIDSKWLELFHLH